MKIKTKYDLGDIVRFRDPNRPIQHIGRIYKIEITRQDTRKYEDEVYHIDTNVLELGWGKSSVFHSICVNDILFKLNKKEIEKAWYQNIVNNDVEYFIKKAKEEVK